MHFYSLPLRFHKPDTIEAWDKEQIPIGDAALEEIGHDQIRMTTFGQIYIKFVCFHTNKPCHSLHLPDIQLANPTT